MSDGINQKADHLAGFGCVAKTTSSSAKGLRIRVSMAMAVLASTSMVIQLTVRAQRSDDATVSRPS